MDKRFDFVILTDQRYLSNSSNLKYIQNVLLEDGLLCQALLKLGFKVGRKAWDDDAFDWKQTRSVVFRSTWDYFDRFDEFFPWLKNVQHQTQLINSADLILWNIDKFYLRELNEKGVAIPETIFVEKGDLSSLASIAAQIKCDTVILKPAVSGAARETFKIHKSDIDQYEQKYNTLIKDERMLIQAFLPSIETEGEVSLIFFDGSYSHSILKMAKQGDFRVQDDFGGTVKVIDPPLQLIHTAKTWVSLLPELPAYARVDVMNDKGGKWVLSEMELIEPELWFRWFPEAATHCATSIANQLA